MLVRIALDLDRHPNINSGSKHCFMQLNEQESTWAILGIIEKEFCQRDCNSFCVTLCRFDADPVPDPDRHQTRYKFGLKNTALCSLMNRIHVGIVEKEFCKWDYNYCCVTLCHDYFRKKRSQDAVFSSPGLHPGKSAILFIFLEVQKPFCFKNSPFLLLFCLRITFKGAGRRVANTNHLINRGIKIIEDKDTFCCRWNSPPLPSFCHSAILFLNRFRNKFEPIDKEIWFFLPQN